MKRPPKLKTKVSCHPSWSDVIRSDFPGCDAPDVAGVQQMLVSEGEGAEIVKRLDMYEPLVERATKLWQALATYGRHVPHQSACNVAECAETCPKRHVLAVLQETALAATEIPGEPKP